MALGSTQTIIVCVPSAFPQAPCPSGMAISTVQGYVIDFSQAANIEAQFAPFDYTAATAIFGLGFTSVVGLFLVARSAGTILNFIRGRT